MLSLLVDMASTYPDIIYLIFLFKDTAFEKHMIWLTAYDESRAIRNVKLGQESLSTVLDSHFWFLRYSVSNSVFFV